MFERRFIELRQEGRKLSGVAIRYGEVATIGDTFRERFEAGAFTPIGDVVLNVQHDRGRPISRTGAGLTLDDTPERLAIRATLPDTTEADDVLINVKAGILKGLSIEFQATEERLVSGVRVIERGRLAGVAVVDTGAYPGSTLEARARFNPWLRAEWKARKKGACKCQGPDVEDVIFEPGAWSATVQSNREVLAVAGDYSKAVASRRNGTLQLTERDDGGLDIALSREAAGTPSGRDLTAMSKAVPLTVRPILDNDKSAFTDASKTRTFSEAHLRAVLIKPTEDVEGWEPASLIEPKPVSKSRRSRLWL